MRVAGLFAGIGGLEQGFTLAGHETTMLCEIDDAARAVLRSRIPGVPIERDVRALRSFGGADVVTAGFPCGDISPAGRTLGIDGSNSGLIREVFRLVSVARRRPSWIVLENVPFLLRLGRGRGIRAITTALTTLDYRWAYRVVNTQSFGLPQRRRRVLLVASNRHDPRGVLLAGEGRAPLRRASPAPGQGFYWTEGNRGLGWAVDAVPTLKGTSSLGIASPPAIWRPRSHAICTPDIQDGERLQGFEPGWTAAAIEVSSRVGIRWRLVGNAVSVPVARWLGARLAAPEDYWGTEDPVLDADAPWPDAAWSDGMRIRVAHCSDNPVGQETPHLLSFLRFATRPLSERATRGFKTRVEASRLKCPDGFLDDLASHLHQVGKEQATAA